jgi:outer membrane receptor protein involved in Fe transport
LRTEAQFDLSPTEKNSVTFGSELILDRVDASIFGDHDAWGWAAYLQDEYRIFKPFSITTGLRYDLFQIDQEITDHEWSPKLGFVYRPNLVTSLRASVGHGFRAPTMAEMFTRTVVSGFLVVPNPELTAERSWSYEIGLNQAIRQNIFLDMALFSTDYWNLIEGQPDETNTIQFDNLTRARIAGAEVTFRTSWWQRILGLDVSYTYMEPRDLTLDQTLAYRPRHLFSTSVSLNVGPVGFNADYRYTSRIDAVLIYPDDDRVAQKMADARLSYDWRNYQFSFDVDNIFNYNYVPVERNIAPVRKFMLTLSAKY